MTRFLLAVSAVILLAACGGPVTPPPPGHPPTARVRVVATNLSAETRAIALSLAWDGGAFATTPEAIQPGGSGTPLEAEVPVGVSFTATASMGSETATSADVAFSAEDARACVATAFDGRVPLTMYCEQANP